MRDTAGSAAAPAARCRNCLRGSFMSSLPEECIEGHAPLRLPLTDFQIGNVRQPMALALPLNERDSAHRLGSSRIRLHHGRIARKGPTPLSMSALMSAMR